MTIRKGEDWGWTGLLPDGAPIVGSDSELASLFTIDGETLSGPSHVGITTGDIARTVGASAAAETLASEPRTTLPIDLGLVSIDGSQLVMAASLVIRRRWWTGPIDAAMNASFLGEWNMTPSGHPNDGRFDVVHAELSPSDRIKARKRLPNGTHVPHPNISIRRLRRATFEPDSRCRVWVDGVCFGPARHIDFVVHADAVHVVI